MRYQVLRCNRLWVVTDNETKTIYGDPWKTEIEATEAAGRLNRRVWLEQRPEGESSWGSDWDRRLEEILSKIWPDQVAA